MIISRKYAQKLIRDGKARVTGIVHDNGKQYAILTRYDKQSTDHYQIDSGMRGARKCIRRVNPDTARAAMARHIEKMNAKGWLVSHQFEGDHYCRYECITYFCR